MSRAFFTYVRALLSHCCFLFLWKEEIPNSAHEMKSLQCVYILYMYMSLYVCVCYEYYILCVIETTVQIICVSACEYVCL